MRPLNACYKPTHGMCMQAMTGQLFSFIAVLRACSALMDVSQLCDVFQGICLRRVPAGAQSILTGESGSVAKFVDAVNTHKAVYQDKTCLLFSARFLAHARSSSCTLL